MGNDIQHFIDHKCSFLVPTKTHVVSQAPLRTITANTPMGIIAVEFLKENGAAERGGQESFVHFESLTSTLSKKDKTTMD